MAIIEAGKAGKPGSLAFTVALRRTVARLNGNNRLTGWPIRRIERDIAFDSNVLTGIVGNEHSMVFNGSPVMSGNFGTMYDSVVAILDVNRTVKCSGLAITSTRILTAKHCLIDADVVEEGDDLSGSGVFTVIGTADFAGADVGLLFLKTGISSSTFFARAKTTDIDRASLMRAMGFGKNSNGVAGTKAFTDVGIDRYHCSSTDATTYGCSIPEEMVADNKVNNADTCEGDSGGPAFVGTPNAHQVAAVISRGVKPGRDCIDGSVYVRIDSDAISKFIDEAAPTLVGPHAPHVRRR